MAITIEHSLDRQIVERVNYTFLDVLSDVGGLTSVIASVFAILLAIVNRNILDQHMVKQLYKFKDKHSGNSEGQ